MAETAPQTILAGRYVLEREIGRGGMATVWRAKDEVLDRPVAVKILHEHLQEDPAFRERFNTEALSAARLAHPNIVNVFDTGSDGVSFIVMELFEGRTLARVIEDEGPLEPRRAIDILAPVLSALQFAHQNGVIHRDVKPGNILVGDSGMVKITDLGIARAAFTNSDVTTTGKVLGSVPYLSPEQVQGTEVDARSDVYACGVVLYEMLTKRRPFQAETDLASAMLRLTKDPLAPRAIRPGIPRSFEDVVLRAMARKPEDRYETAENMAAALIRLPGGSATRQFTPPVRRPRPEPSQADGGPGVFRSWMLVPGVAVLVAVIAILVGIAVGKLELGGPLGVETKKENSGGGATPVVTAYQASNVTPFDPFGDGSEHDDEIGLVDDGNAGTYWTTENYNELNLAPKPGVGVLFDLGQARPVSGFRLSTPFPDFEFQVRVGDDPGSLASTEAPSFQAASTMDERLPQEQTGRYVLVWITTVVPGVDDGNRAAIGEFKVLGPGG